MSDSTPTTSEYPPITLCAGHGEISVTGDGVVTHTPPGGREPSTWDTQRDRKQLLACQAFLERERDCLIAQHCTSETDGVPNTKLLAFASLVDWVRVYCCEAPEDIDPGQEFTWRGLCVGFFLGKGFNPEQANQLADKVPY